MKRAQYWENIGMGLDTIRSHKMRSFLTVLGVIIGVATVIVIASILTGMRANILSLVEQYGTNSIWAFHLSTGPQTGPRDRKEFTRRPLAVADAEAIRALADAVEGVGYVGFGFRISGTARYRGEVFPNGLLQGVSPNMLSVSNGVLREGRYLTAADDRHRSHVAVLGTNVADALFPDGRRMVGRVINVAGKNLTVVGVLEQRKQTFLGDTGDDNVIQIPYRTLRKISPRDDWVLLHMQARQGRLVEALDQVEGVLRRQRGLRNQDDNDFDVNTYDRIVEQFDAIVGAVGLAAIAISGVGLLVGGIGVMNIMLVSVTERTREIGVRKAIGARRMDIAFQFLFEAMTLTSAGGILGVLFAVAVSYLVLLALPDLPAQIPLWAVTAGLGVSVSVGLLFGVWPAVKASRLDPIECLRYE